MTTTVKAAAAPAQPTGEEREAQLARDLALLQARFGPPQPRAPLRGQPALPGVGGRPRRRAERAPDAC